ncbi:MAG: hypothetical protein PHH58_03165 [Rhodoferax sp.]|nr:hypothetical protein [Rhodoferax sp.]
MKPGRKVALAAEVIDVPMNTALLAQDFSAANELALATAQQASAVRAVALQLGYQLPADCTDPDLIQRDISANMRRSVEACLEVGKGLEVLKAACSYGQFLSRVDVLGIDVTVAKRFRQAARKFSKGASTHLLKAAGNQTKLFEMIVLDDDQIEELELTGQTGELALDDVATMSVKELRAAVRKERTVKQRLESVNQELHAEVINLKLDKKVVAITDWPDALVPVSDQVAAAGRKLAQALSELETCRITIFEKAAELAEDDRASLEAALGHVADVYEEALARAERSIGRERLTFDKTLGAFSKEGA